MGEPQVFGFFSIDSVAAVYDVPRVFNPWGRLLMERAALGPGEAVLDVATWPGAMARLAAERVGRSGRVVGTDVSPAMIGIAREKTALPDAALIEYLAAPAAPLPVADASFDLVLCQQGLQFFPDRPAAINEMHRALKPGGRLAAVSREIALQPIFAAVDAARRECVPADQARPYGARSAGRGRMI